MASPVDLISGERTLDDVLGGGEFGWRSGKAPWVWTVYAALLVIASVPFFVRGLLALANPPVGAGVLCALFVMLLIANLCILELRPYRFLHLATGFFVFGGFFIAGPAILGLLALSIKPSEWSTRRLLAWLDRPPPIGGAPAEYCVPAAAIAIVLGLVDSVRAPLTFSYPFRPLDAFDEGLFFLLLGASYAGFVVLTEIGFYLRFGWERVFGGERARIDLLVYLLGTLLGGPIVAAAVHVYGSDFPHALFALGWMVWGYGIFAIAAILIERGRRIDRLVGEARSRERLATLGRLASVIAHQTRHHLGILNMSAYVLGETLAKETLSSSARDAVAAELEAIARTREELDRLLTQELRGGSHEERFGLLELARECGGELSPLATARRVTLGYDGEERQTRGDRLRLKQALGNVLRNAIEASPAGVGVTVALADEEEDLCLRVQDGGPGLSATARQRLFEPLFTDKADGLGMGLYVARAIVEAHGGTITLDSDERGTHAEIRVRRDS